MVIPAVGFSGSNADIQVIEKASGKPLHHTYWTRGARPEWMTLHIQPMTSMPILYKTLHQTERKWFLEIAAEMSEIGTGGKEY